MIALVTGPLGTGKSYYAVRKIARALNDGKYVATNVDLAEDWSERVARSSLWRRLVPGRVARRAHELRRRVLVTEELDELVRVRLEGKGEGRGIMVLDEAHNWLNARLWSQGDRLALVRFFSQSRKLGWDIYLIAQDADMLDKQVRVLFEEHVQLRNLRRARIAGVRVFPFNLFLATRVWAHGDKVILGRDLYRLDWSRHLYNTMATSHGLVGDDDDAIWLPRPNA
jgi:hypothetical protein